MSVNNLIFYLLIAGVVVGVLAKALSLFVTAKRRAQKIATSEIVKGKVQLGPADLCVPVRYASAAFFRRFFNFIPWETTGVLVVSDSEFLFCPQVVNNQHQPSVLRFPRDNCLVVYVERRWIRDGGLSWFYLEVEDPKSGENIRHYFSTEGSLPNMTSEFGTTALYEKMTEQYSTGSGN